MRIRYTTTHSSQQPTDVLPRVERLFTANGREPIALGLVDSGATVNVLPYQIGLNLDFEWDADLARVQLSGNLSVFKAMPVAAMARLGDFDPVKLIFAWV